MQHFEKFRGFISAWYYFIICVGFYILDMSPNESFFLITNRWSNIKQFAVVTFSLLECLYLSIYHPSNHTSLEMSKILTDTQLKRNLLSISLQCNRKVIIEASSNPPFSEVKFL